MTVLYRMTTKEWRNDVFFCQFIIKDRIIRNLFLFVVETCSDHFLIKNWPIGSRCTNTLKKSLQTHSHEFEPIRNFTMISPFMLFMPFHWTTIGRTFRNSANWNKIKINFKYFWLTNFFLRAHPDWSISIQKQTNWILSFRSKLELVFRSFWFPKIERDERSFFLLKFTWRRDRENLQFL